MVKDAADSKLQKFGNKPGIVAVEPGKVTPNQEKSLSSRLKSASRQEKWLRAGLDAVESNRNVYNIKKYNYYYKFYNKA